MLLITALAIWVVGGTDKVLVTFVDDVVEVRGNNYLALGPVKTL